MSNRLFNVEFKTVAFDDVLCDFHNYKKVALFAYQNYQSEPYIRCKNKNGQYVWLCCSNNCVMINDYDDIYYFHEQLFFVLKESIKDEKSNCENTFLKKNKKELLDMFYSLIDDDEYMNKIYSEVDNIVTI
jgi:hypothetical protein